MLSSKEIEHILNPQVTRCQNWNKKTLKTIHLKLILQMETIKPRENKKVTQQHSLDSLRRRTGFGEK
jgi:hypothetical protein